MPRRPERQPHPNVPTAVLDSEALAAVASPNERGAAARRAQAVLEAVERRGGRAVVAAPVLAEVSRGPRRRAAVDRVLSRLPVIPTDRAVAERAGTLLENHRLDSRHAVDAFVVATAAGLGHSVILTGDSLDLSTLAAEHLAVAIQQLP